MNTKLHHGAGLATAASNAAKRRPGPTVGAGQPARFRHDPAGDEWMRDAACQGEDPSLFQPDGESGPYAGQIADARRICLQCPVRVACLDFALATRQPSGVWGGTTVGERERALEARTRHAREARQAAA